MLHIRWHSTGRSACPACGMSCGVHPASMPVRHAHTHIVRMLVQVITASSDGTVRVWDAKSCESLLVVKPPQTASGAEPSVHSVWAHPQNPDQVFVCPRSTTVFLMTLKGQVRHPLYAAMPQLC